MDLPLLFTFWQFPEPAVWYIGVSLLLGLAATALFYLVAYFFQHPPMSAAAKEELAAFLMSVAIIGLWFFIQASIGKFTCLLATNNPGCNSSFIDLSFGSLEILFQKLRSIYMSLYLFEVLLGFLSTVYVPLGTFNPLLSLLPVSLPPLVSLSLLSNAHTVLVEAIGMTMVAIIAKQHLLQFAQYGVPTVLLPLGLALRAFPWFRATGSSLIAICIVAYFVYPLSTLLSNYLIFDLYQPADFVYAPTALGLCNPDDPANSAQVRDEKLKEIQDLQSDWSSLLDKPASPVGADVETDAGSFWNRVVGWVKGVGSAIWSVAESTYHIFKAMIKIFGDFGLGMLSFFWGATPFGPVAGMYYFIVEEVVMVSQFVILVLITSVFEIIITITMYRNISALIGGEIDIIGLSKLV